LVGVDATDVGMTRKKRSRSICGGLPQRAMRERGGLIALFSPCGETGPVKRVLKAPDPKERVAARRPCPI
jgi:hypothetical protein